MQGRWFMKGGNRPVHRGAGAGDRAGAGRQRPDGECRHLGACEPAGACGGGGYLRRSLCAGAGGTADGERHRRWTGGNPLFIGGRPFRGRARAGMVTRGLLTLLARKSLALSRRTVHTAPKTIRKSSSPTSPTRPSRPGGRFFPSPLTASSWPITSASTGARCRVSSQRCGGKGYLSTEKRVCIKTGGGLDVIV